MSEIFRECEKCEDHLYTVGKNKHIEVRPGHMIPVCDECYLENMENKVDNLDYQLKRQLIKYEKLNENNKKTCIKIHVAINLLTKRRQEIKNLTKNLKEAIRLMSTGGLIETRVFVNKHKEYLEDHESKTEK